MQADDDFKVAYFTYQVQKKCWFCHLAASGGGVKSVDLL